MNGKKAKALRRAARESSNGRRIAYKPLKQTIVHKGLVPIPGRDYAIHLGHVEMTQNCERAVYQRLKKTAKHLTIAELNVFQAARELRRAA